jgi:hypothetical protein
MRRRTALTGGLAAITAGGIWAALALLPATAGTLGRRPRGPPRRAIRPW